MNALSHLADALLTRLVWTSIQATVLDRRCAADRAPAATVARRGALLAVVAGRPAAAARALLARATGTAAAGAGVGVGVGQPCTQELMPATLTSDPRHLRVRAMPTSQPRHTRSTAATSRAVPWRELLPVAMAGGDAGPAATAGATVAPHAAAAALVPRRSTMLRMQALCAQRARALGLRRCPPLFVCADIASPQVNGLRQPVVLLPAVHAMTPAESAMAIAHELAHLRRGDLWLGWLPAIAGRLFFFHPLVRWAMREYALRTRGRLRCGSTADRPARCPRPMPSCCCGWAYPTRCMPVSPAHPPRSRISRGD